MWVVSAEERWAANQVELEEHHIIINRYTKESKVREGLLLNQVNLLIKRLQYTKVLQTRAVRHVYMELQKSRWCRKHIQENRSNDLIKFVDYSNINFVISHYWYRIDWNDRIYDGHFYNIIWEINIINNEIDLNIAVSY